MCTVRNTRVGSVRHGFGVSTQHKIDPQELISRYCSCEYTRHPTPSVGNVTGTWGSPRLPVSGACPCALRVGESFILVQRDSFRRYLEKSPEYECSQQVRRCSSPFEAEGSSQRQAALPGQPFKIQFTIHSATSRTPVRPSRRGRGHGRGKKSGKENPRSWKITGSSEGGSVGPVGVTKPEV